MIRRFVVGLIAACSVATSALGQASLQMYNYIDQLVRQRNTNALRQFVQQHQNLDYIDSEGDTPLCTAIRRNDYAGYRLLAQLGASRQHACVQQMSMDEKEMFNARYKSYVSAMKSQAVQPTMTAIPASSLNAGVSSAVLWGVGGAVGLGAIAAAAAAGGGGGGGSKSSVDTGNSTPVYPITSPTPTPTLKPTPTPSVSPTPNPTPSPTPTPSVSPTPNPTPSPTPTPSVSPTPNPTPSPTPTPSVSPTPNPTPSPTPTPSVSPTPNPTPSPTPNPTPSPTPSPTPNPNPTPTPTPNPTPSPTPNPTPSPTPTIVTLSPSYFETEEYIASNFLDVVKASGAYAKIYTGYKDESGNITAQHNLQDVIVSVIDSGVATHNDLKSHLLPGFNYDYGPCTDIHTTNCWKYKEADYLITRRTGIAFVDSNGNEGSIHLTMTESEYKEWKKEYDPSYTWVSTDTLPNTGPASLEDDDAMHGTHVAGIISADKNGVGMHGVAPNAKILPIKYGFMEALSDPIITAIDNGARVINTSLGHDANSLFNASIAKKNRSTYASYMEDALDGFKKLADTQSTVWVTSAGNEGYSEPSLESGAGLYFQELKKVMIVVVAYDPSTKELAYFPPITDEEGWGSNYCGSTKEYCLAAPGVDVNSTIRDNTTAQWGGTSMAAPVVSGAAALLMGASPSLTAAQVTELLLTTATDLGEPGVDEIYGHGLLNLEAAMSPVGTVSLTTTAEVNGERLPLKGTQLAVPRAMSQILRQLPASISVLDAYDRSFAMNTTSFIRKNSRDTRVFQNQLHRFSRFDSIRHIHEEKSPLSFSYSTASKKNSNSGIGAMDMAWQFDANKVRFYYTEDTQYGNGAFFDRVTLNPFTAMDDACGVENTYSLNKKTKFGFGFANGRNALFKTDEEQKEEAGRLTSFQGFATYKPQKDLSLQLTGGAVQEEESVLGLRGSGAFDVDSTRTYYVGLNATKEIGEKLTLKGSYYYGKTPAQKLNAYVRTNQLYSESIAFDARWHTDSENYFGLFAQSPLRIKRGNAVFRLPTGRDYDTNTVQFDTVKTSMATEKREWDFGLYGVYTHTPSLKFKGQTGVRIHPEHQAHNRPDYQVLFGLDWHWN